MGPLNQRLEEIERMLGASIRAFRERFMRPRPVFRIPRVFSHVNDDSDLDDSPYAFVGAKLRPRHPLGGSAIALQEPDEDRVVEANGARR